MDQYAAINARACILSYYSPKPCESALGKRIEPFERAKSEWLKAARLAISQVEEMTFGDWDGLSATFKARKPDECFECGQRYKNRDDPLGAATGDSGNGS